MKQEREDDVQAMVQMVSNWDQMKSQLDAQKNQTLQMVTKHAIERNSSRAELEKYETIMIDLGFDKSKLTELEPKDLVNEYKNSQQQKEDDLFRCGLISG